MFNCAVGREEHCKQISLAYEGNARNVWVTLGLPHSRRVCFPSLHCSGSRLLCRKLSEAGPGLCAFPRSKSLRFRLFHIPPRHRLLCFLPFSGLSSLGDQVLGEHTLPRWVVCLITSPVPAAWFPGCATGVLSEVCCVSALGS